MKLIIAGATGLIGHELVRQSLQLSAITQVVALARKPIQIEASNSSKLKSVTIDDYGEYPEHIKTELAGADACIWTVGITPLKSTKMDFAEVKRVCQDCTLAGFKAICEAGPARPFRFVYFSGQGVPQDPGVVKKGFLGDYITMRSEIEQTVRQFPQKYSDVEICIARPGLVTNCSTWTSAAVSSVFRGLNVFTRAVPNVKLEEVGAAVLGRVVGGFESETLSNQDLVRIGRAS